MNRDLTDFEAKLERWLDSTAVAQCLIIGFIFIAGVLAAILANINLIRP